MEGCLPWLHAVAGSRASFMWCLLTARGIECRTVVVSEAPTIANAMHGGPCTLPIADVRRPSELVRRCTVSPASRRQAALGNCGMSFTRETTRSYSLTGWFQPGLLTLRRKAMPS